jgi:hypothetical protein
MPIPLCSIGTAIVTGISTAFFPGGIIFSFQKF